MLLGAQITPPEVEVEPPNFSVFSRMTAFLPTVFSQRAAVTEPAPLPTMTKSKLSSKATVSPPVILTVDVNGWASATPFPVWGPRLRRSGDLLGDQGVVDGGDPAHVANLGFVERAAAVHGAA